MRSIPLPQNVKTAIRLLNSAGFRADIVGGCVRDFLLGKIPYDYDITTNASPEEMQRIFCGFRTVEAGLKHGTLTVIMDSESIEITTYRRDGEYKDHRHPESVEFTTELPSDLSRRDFTMNAICYNEHDGFTDLYGGREDISRRIIRAVGDPCKRFEEDALRVMRAVRFAATLGFAVEDKTAEAARIKRAHLRLVSGERIYVEWRKLLSGEFAYPVLAEYSDVITAALGMSDYTLPNESDFADADFYSRFFSLFFDFSDPVAEFAAVCERLKADNRLKKYGLTVLSSIDRDLSTSAAIKRAMSELGEEEAELLIKCRILKGVANAAELSELYRIVASAEPYKLSHLAIGGKDVMALGIRGTEVGRALARLLEAVVSGTVRNGREELIEYLKSDTHAD